MAFNFTTTSPGELRCNTINFKYKQARNLIANAHFESGDSGWTFSGGVSRAPNGYRSPHCVQAPAGGTQMTRQTMTSAPIAGHKYYGGLMWWTPGNNFSVSDNRFEWFLNDTTNGKMVFANKTVATGGQWVKLSSIQTLPTVLEGTWEIRNFLIDSSTISRWDCLMIIDLTDTFGAGNEPSKEWCDTYILQWSQFFGYGANTLPITQDELTEIYTPRNLRTNTAFYGYHGLPFQSHYPADYLIDVFGDAAYSEGYLDHSIANINITQGNYYYWMLHSTNRLSESMDCYFPVTEPRLNGISVPFAYGQSYNGGGGHAAWKKYSLYGQRSNWPSGSYPLRIDLNNGNQATSGWWTNLCLINVNLFLNSINSFFNVNWTVSQVNKEFMDRWCGGFNPTTIQVPDPAFNYIELNSANGNIITCNDIQITPGKTTIDIDTMTGIIYCGKLTRVQPN